MSKILFASISKKLIMALAGLFLITFLPVHLSINLMLLIHDPLPFNTAAHFMATFPVIRVLEVVLFSLIFIHIGWGVFLQIQNWFARPVGYKAVNKANTSFFSRFMIWTGGTILVFFVLHWFNFYFIKVGIVPGNAEDFYSVAHQLFKIPAYSIIYLTCFVVLGFHLYHAFFSAFQTLGLRNWFWSPVIKTIGVIYAFVIPAGFALIAVILWLFR
jgi:succinate dehydrogenase / fumarate reductase, cytochrome b subunit